MYSVCGQATSSLFIVISTKLLQCQYKPAAAEIRFETKNCIDSVTMEKWAGQEEKCTLRVIIIFLFKRNVQIRALSVIDEVFLFATRVNYCGESSFLLGYL